MGRRGPTPKPTAQKRAEGQRLRADRDRPDQPKYGAIERDPPEFLDDVSRAEWFRVIDLLARSGVVTEIDAMALGAYCEAWSAYRAALDVHREICETDRGTLFRGQLSEKKTGDLVTHPAARNLRDARKAALEAASHFGLTPSTRSRLSVANSGPAPADPAAAPANPFAANANRR